VSLESLLGGISFLIERPVGTYSDIVTKEVEFPLRFGSILEQGFPRGSTVSLFGFPGAGKTVFCENLVKGFLNGGFRCVYVSTERAPVDIRNDFRILKTDILKMEAHKKLAFIDGYSWLAGGSNEMFCVENLANLPELAMIIEKAYSYLGGESLVVLDSASPLSLHNPEEDVTKFLQLFAAKIRGWKAIGIFVVQAGVHSEGFYNALAYLVDGMFDLRKTEENGTVRRYFRIRNLRFSAHEVGWMPFIIEEGRDLKLEEKAKSDYR
jgi:KaiC/GvpD/RAD55 family RecA-like ATPase